MIGGGAWRRACARGVRQLDALLEARPRRVTKDRSDARACGVREPAQDIGEAVGDVGVDQRAHV